MSVDGGASRGGVADEIVEAGSELQPGRLLVVRYSPLLLDTTRSALKIHLVSILIVPYPTNR
jgi:hypothetical protein